MHGVKGSNSTTRPTDLQFGPWHDLQLLPLEERGNGSGAPVGQARR